MGTRTETVTTYDAEGREVDHRAVTVTTTPEQDNEDALNDRIDQALAAMVALANGTGTLTAAQLTTELRRVARVTAAVIRLQRRRLDATD